MRNRILLSVILLVASQTVFAIPAKRGTFVKVQPDGSTVKLQRHGDEFFHWTTLEDGTVVEPDASGLYVPAEMPNEERLGGRRLADLEAAAIRAKRAASNTLQLSAGSYTTYHFPVVLVQFSDVQFNSSTAQNDFYRLLNEEGYSDNGGTGSVRDYYWENSLGRFLAEFDVFGPYTYNGNCADNAEEEDAAKILWDVMSAHDSDIDWSKYDNDGDGAVDMVFMYYAGYNEAEGADDTIWPHKWNFSSAGVSTSKLDGKSFSIYACTSELQGTSGEEMCGIGTCAHEFSHTQGLPDFYDVTYDNYGDGEAGATYSYDIMCSGSYNNDGRTPPYFNAEERIMMGWMDGFESVPESGDFTIPSIDNNIAYKLSTSNTTGGGEYFIFECRSGQGWDAFVEPGLVVYHVDKSTKYTFSVKTSRTASYNFTGNQVWTSYTQYINASGSHPCFYIVPAADQSNLDYSNGSKMPFPGKAGISYYSPADWAGNTDYGMFSEITFHADGSAYGYGQVVTITRGENYKGLCGFIMDSSGNPVKGAELNLYTPSPSGVISIEDISGPEMISGRIPANLKASLTTDDSGYYSFNLDDLGLSSLSSIDIEIVASGYITKYETTAVSDNLQTKNFTMRGIDEPVSYTLRKFNSLDKVYGLGYGSTCNTYASILLSADDLADYVGRKILSLTFSYSLGDEGSVSKVYGIIEAGGQRILTSQVNDPVASKWNTIDLSSNDLYIEAGKDYNFGYGLLSCTYAYPMLFSNEDPQEGGFNYYLAAASTTVSTSALSWNEYSGGNLLIFVVLDDSSEIDYNYILNPGYGNYSVGDEFALTLVEATGEGKPASEVQWYFDDEPVNGDSVKLKYPGYHLIEARFTSKEGKSKIIELEINVNL